MFESLHVPTAATIYQYLIIWWHCLLVSSIYCAYIIDNRTGSCAQLIPLFPRWTGVHEVMTYDE